ncbi:MAG: hypothetical protein ACI4XR_04165 [Bacilli bacterium]
MIIDRIENEIVLKDQEKIIEKYNFEKEINFEKLTKTLLKKNLSETINLEDNIKEKEEKEENLIKLIRSIIDDYNQKVEEYNAFISKIE